MPESGMMELTAMEAGAGRDGTWRMEAAGGPEVTNSAVEASAASEVPTTVKSAAASEMSATAPMSTAPMSAAARRGSRSRRQGCAKSDHAKQFQSFHLFSPATWCRPRLNLCRTLIGPRPADASMFAGCALAVFSIGRGCFSFAREAGIRANGPLILLT
jgi:hypothetical protein